MIFFTDIIVGVGVIYVFLKNNGKIIDDLFDVVCVQKNSKKN